MNYYDTLIEVAEDCPAKEAQVPQARGAKKTKAVVEYELLAKHPYKYTEEDIAFEIYAVLHDIPKAIWPTERKKFLSRGHPHLRVSALAKRYGWGIHNDARGERPDHGDDDNAARPGTCTGCEESIAYHRSSVDLTPIPGAHPYTLTCSVVVLIPFPSPPRGVNGEWWGSE